MMILHFFFDDLSPIFLRKNSIALFFIYIFEANRNNQLQRETPLHLLLPPFLFSISCKMSPQKKALLLIC